MHCLLLDPVVYHNVCDNILTLRGVSAAERSKRLLPYNPLGGDDITAQQQRYQRSVQEYVREFGNAPPEEFWPAPTTTAAEMNKNMNVDIVTTSSTANTTTRLMNASGAEIAASKRHIGDDEHRDKKQKNAVAANATAQGMVTGNRAMKIYIKTMTNEQFALQLLPTELVENVREMVQRKTGNEPDLQRLIYQGKQMSDGCTLADYNVQSGSKIFLVLRLRGC